MNRLPDSLGEPATTERESAPQAPVSRPEGNGGGIAPEASHGRPTGPRGARFGGSARPYALESRMMAANTSDPDLMLAAVRKRVLC